MAVKKHSERRQDPRLPLRMPVLCERRRVRDSRTLGLTRNVSRSGLLLEGVEPLSPGTSASLRLLAGERIARAHAVVVWTSKVFPGSMGLRFTMMTGATYHAWAELLASQSGQPPRTSLRIPIDLEVTCVVPPGTRVAGRIENLSDGGLLVVLPRHLPPRTHLRVKGPPWITLPLAEAEVVWSRAGSERDGVLHGLRVLEDEVSKELFLIGTMIRMLFG
ncbi:MAG: PilZ domain-containing protein [Candidatus Methylomirabilales bacterium]